MHLAMLALIGPPTQLEARLAAAEAWLPFAPAACLRERFDAGEAGSSPGDVVLLARWFAVDPEARRRPATLTTTPEGWRAASGWWRRRGGGGLAALGSLWPQTADHQGQGVLLWQGSGGPLDGTCDVHGGGLLYHGAADGVVAVGNRATLVGAALSPESGPELDPLETLWPLARPGAPVGAETAWRGVSLLPQGGLLRVSGGRVLVKPAPPLEGRMHDLDGLVAGLVDRCRALDDWPDHEVEVMMSGGKDIRGVLAGLQASGRLSRVSRGVIWAPEGDADLSVARQLGEALGFPVHVRESPVSAGPWQEGFLRHAFLGEAMVHAWDRKGLPEIADVVVLNGYFGELYKSHVQHLFALGPLAVRAFYGRRAWRDRHGLLTPDAHAHLARRFGDWLDARMAEGPPWHLLNDRWHREARMQRWVGHILQAEACATPWLQLLPNLDLLERYVGGPLRDRTQHRLAFELVRQLAPELLQLPLAAARWSPKLDETWRPPDPTPQQASAPGPQAALWQAHGREMAAWLREGRADGLFELVDAKALDRLLERALGPGPTRHDLIGLMALLGVRAALARPTPRPIQVR